MRINVVNTASRAGMLCLLFLAGGCSCDTPYPSVGRNEAPVFSQRQPLEAAQATKQVGEDCTQAGRSECLSGLCIHFKPGPDEGYACSVPCDDSVDCPAEWNCVSILPGAGNSYCIPPLKHSGAGAIVPPTRAKPNHPTTAPGNWVRPAPFDAGLALQDLTGGAP
jgi:hypothetical protein